MRQTKMVSNGADQPENNRDMASSFRRLGNLVENWQGVYDQLLSQTESIERIDELNSDSLSNLLFPSKKNDTDIVYFSGIMKELLDSLSHYKKLFKTKGLYLTHENIDHQLFIRLRPEFIALVFRNILDNWSKYATSSRALSVALTPSYDPVRRPENYILSFSNTARNITQVENIEKLFIFGERVQENSNEVEGDGVGLFWIKYILEEQNDIQVSIRTEEFGSSSEECLFILEIKLKPHWLTYNPEISLETQ